MDPESASRRLNPENEPNSSSRTWDILLLLLLRVKGDCAAGYHDVVRTHASSGHPPQPSAELLCRHLGHDHQACSWRTMPQLCFPPPTPSRASASSSGGSRSQAGPMGQAVASVVAQAPGRPRDAPSTNTCSFVHLGCTLAVLLYLLQLQCLQFHFSARWTTPFCHLSHLSITCSFIKLASHVSQSPMYHTVYYFVQTALHANAYCNESLIWFKVSGVPQTLKYCRDSS